MWQKLLKILLGDATGRIDPLKLLEDSNYITEGGEEPPKHSQEDLYQNQHPPINHTATLDWGHRSPARLAQDSFAVFCAKK